MEFSRLMASIANNTEEAPSIYMAICMVESLLDDIEDVTGQEIGDWPIGDDTLPTKMVWLCQTINQIYEEKSGELIRNRTRLDTAMNELRRVSAELETLSETAVQLSAVKTDLKKAETDLEERQAALERARAEREEYEEIQERCRRLQLEADSLGSFDKAAEEARVQTLQMENTALAEEISGLKAELADVMADRDKIVETTADLKSEIEKTTALLEQKNNALSDMKKQRLELTDRLRRVTEELSGLQDAVFQLQTENIPERERQRNDEEERKNSLEQRLESLELETRQLLEKNQEKRRKAEELSKRKEQAEGVERDISSVLRKLEPIASEDFIIQMEENRQRLDMLETVRESLSGTLSDMKEILGEMPVSDNGVRLDSMKDILQGLLNCTDKLQHDLVTYARNVTLEEHR